MKLLPFELKSLKSTPPRRFRTRRVLGLLHTRNVVERVLRHAVHAKRVMSLANAVAGALRAGSAGVHAIGQAYAALADIDPKHGIKQVDRLLSNSGVRLRDVMAAWAKYVVGDHPSIVVALDWTDFEHDDHVTLYVAMVTSHGRALPLAWRTVKKSTLKGNQNRYESELIHELHDWLPKETAVTLLADRGFGKVDFYEILEALRWNFVIRFKQDVLVDDGTEKKKAGLWVPTNGRVRRVKGARLTGRGFEVPAVVMVKTKGMKESWCLATSLKDEAPAQIVKYYSRRFTIEETFRDTKDLNFGMGLRARHIADAERRDRLLLIIGIAHTLLTLLGAASERAGLDKALKANTVKRRTHSLYRQGCIWYDMLPDLREERRGPLLEAFDAIIRENRFFSYALGLTGPIEAPK